MKEKKSFEKEQKETKREKKERENGIMAVYHDKKKEEYA